jgi:hypothetical protein
MCDDTQLTDFLRTFDTFEADCLPVTGCFRDNWHEYHEVQAKIEQRETAQNLKLVCMDMLHNGMLAGLDCLSSLSSSGLSVDYILVVVSATTNHYLLSAYA